MLVCGFFTECSEQVFFVVFFEHTDFYAATAKRSRVVVSRQFFFEIERVQIYTMLERIRHYRRDCARYCQTFHVQAVVKSVFANGCEVVLRVWDFYVFVLACVLFQLIA